MTMAKAITSSYAPMGAVAVGASVANVLAQVLSLLALLVQKYKYRHRRSSVPGKKGLNVCSVDGLMLLVYEALSY
jgi:hypothetical protein